MLEVPAQSIESPTHEDIEAPAARIADHLVERRPTVLRAAHPTVDVVRRHPTTSGDVAVKLRQLILGFLVESQATTWPRTQSG